MILLHLYVTHQFLHIYYILNKYNMMLTLYYGSTGPTFYNKVYNTYIPSVIL